MKNILNVSVLAKVAYNAPERQCFADIVGALPKQIKKHLGENYALQYLYKIVYSRAEGPKFIVSAQYPQCDNAYLKQNAGLRICAEDLGQQRRQSGGLRSAEANRRIL